MYMIVPTRVVQGPNRFEAFLKFRGFRLGFSGFFLGGGWNFKSGISASTDPMHKKKKQRVVFTRDMPCLEA